MGNDMHAHADIDTGTRRGWLTCVYETVDAVLEGDVPPGTASRLHRAIDALKAESPDDDYVARAEAMSLTLHRLQSALLNRRDELTQRSLRQQLRTLSREWIEATPLFH
jgi:hypothetical protein